METTANTHKIRKQVISSGEILQINPAKEARKIQFIIAKSTTKKFRPINREMVNIPFNTSVFHQSQEAKVLRELIQILLRMLCISNHIT